MMERDLLENSGDRKQPLLTKTEKKRKKPRTHAVAPGKIGSNRRSCMTVGKHGFPPGPPWGLYPLTFTNNRKEAAKPYPAFCCPRHSTKRRNGLAFPSVLRVSLFFRPKSEGFIPQSGRKCRFCSGRRALST